MIQLRPHQIAACDAVEASFRAGINRPLLDMCVGSGKSLTMGELARREVARGGRALILAHTRELVEQNASASRQLGLQTGINAAALGERCWRAPVISASIQSVYRSGGSFGPITLVLPDECHLIPHSADGMYRGLFRDLPYARIAGLSGTPYRLQGGSLVEGEGAPFDKVVFNYGIIDGIRDGYLVPPAQINVEDKIDVSGLRTREGDYTGESQDAQTLALMDNHIIQIVHFGANRRSWLFFEASDKSARAMAARLNEWGISADFVLSSKSKADDKRRAESIARYRRGELRALVGMNALTTGFDVQSVDMIVMRRRTKSRGLFEQMIGRGLRTIGGTISASIAAGKEDCAILDFAGNLEQHAPIDWVKMSSVKARFSKCEECGARNAAAAAKCYACGATMCKNCPLCLANIPRYELDCPSCGHDMRQDPGTRKPAQLLDTPSGAALIAAWKPRQSATEGWLPISKVYGSPGGALVDAGEPLTRIELTGLLAERVGDARWIRPDGSALLRPNGASRSSAWQVTPDGKEIIIPFR